MAELDRDAAESFDSLRPHLIRVAYRMLGSVADAEDIAQDAYLRWHHTDRAAVRDPKAFLTRVVTRLCLDQLKSARSRREIYVGPWLPEPVIETAEDAAADDVALPLLMALERLSPLERAAFILHDVFGVDFDEVARAIDRDLAACRQLASRARNHVRAERPRFPVTKEHGRDIAAAFFDAIRKGDVTALSGMLAADVTSYSDGGGKAKAATVPIVGHDAVLAFFAGLSHKIMKEMALLSSDVTINGLPGIILQDASGALQTTAFEIADGKIAAIYTMRNPDKLRHLESFARI